MSNNHDILVQHLTPEEQKKHRDATFLTVITPFATIGIAAMNLFLYETKSGLLNSGWISLAGIIITIFNYYQATKLEKIASSRDELASKTR